MRTHSLAPWSINGTDERPRLTVLLGAGFSQALGLPGTEQITDAVRFAFQNSPDADAARALDERLGALNGGIQTFETIGAALEACALFANVGPVEGEPHYETISQAVSTLHDGLTPEVAERLYAVLMRTVAKQVDISTENIALAPTFGELASFFDELREHFELDVATLNYDRCIETVLGEGNDGFRGEEQHSSFTSRGLLSASCMTVAHLHGAVSWHMLETGAMLMGKASNVVGDRWVMRPDLVPYGSMITGGSKAEKLALPPYSIYNWWFGKCLLESPRLLVIGYGGGDAHINAWLVNYARHHEGKACTAIVDRCDGRMPGSLIQVALLADGAQGDFYRDYLDERPDPVRIGSVSIFRYGVPMSDHETAALLHALSVERVKPSGKLIPFDTFVGLVRQLLDIEASTQGTFECEETLVRWRFAAETCTLWNFVTIGDLTVADASGRSWREQVRLDARNVRRVVSALRRCA